MSINTKGSNSLDCVPPKYTSAFSDKQYELPSNPAAYYCAGSVKKDGLFSCGFILAQPYFLEKGLKREGGGKKFALFTADNEIKLFIF